MKRGFDLYGEKRNEHLNGTRRLTINMAIESSSVIFDQVEGFKD